MSHAHLDTCVELAPHETPFQGILPLPSLVKTYKMPRMAAHRKESLPYIIQEPAILRCPTARIAKETQYFSPSLETVELLDGAPAGTICIAECNRGGFEGGLPVRAIIILDVSASRFAPGETHHDFDRDQIAAGMVRKAASRRATSSCP